MRRLATFAAIILLAGVLSVLASGPAEAWGNHRHCRGHTYLNHTNSWQPFASIKMDVHARACDTIGTRRVPPHLIWTARPDISFHDTNPMGALESAELNSLWFYSATPLQARYKTRVRYRWSVRHCTLFKIGWLCNNFTFGLKIGLPGTQICMVGGANTCDKWKYW